MDDFQRLQFSTNLVLKFFLDASDSSKIVLQGRVETHPSAAQEIFSDQEPYDKDSNLSTCCKWC